MSPKTRATLKNVSVLLGALVAGIGVATGATRFISTAIATADHRYVVRDTFIDYRQAMTEQLHDIIVENARRDALLNRVDARVGAMYCGSLPPNKRAGCQ